MAVDCPQEETSRPPAAGREGVEVRAQPARLHLMGYEAVSIRCRTNTCCSSSALWMDTFLTRWASAVTRMARGGTSGAASVARTARPELASTRHGMAVKLDVSPKPTK